MKHKLIDLQKIINIILIASVCVTGGWSIFKVFNGHQQNIQQINQLHKEMTNVQKSLIVERDFDLSIEKRFTSWFHSLELNVARLQENIKDINKEK